MHFCDYFHLTYYLRKEAYSTVSENMGFADKLLIT